MDEYAYKWVDGSKGDTLIICKNALPRPCSQAFYHITAVIEGRHGNTQYIRLFRILYCMQPRSQTTNLWLGNEVNNHLLPRYMHAWTRR